MPVVVFCPILGKNICMILYWRNALLSDWTDHFPRIHLTSSYSKYAHLFIYCYYSFIKLYCSDSHKKAAFTQRSIHRVEFGRQSWNVTSQIYQPYNYFERIYSNKKNHSIPLVHIVLYFVREADWQFVENCVDHRLNFKIQKGKKATLVWEHDSS